MLGSRATSAMRRIAVALAVFVLGASCAPTPPESALRRQPAVGASVAEAASPSASATRPGDEDRVAAAADTESVVTIARGGTAGATETAPSARTGRRWTIAPYRGLGAWIDVYDWAPSYTNGKPPAVTPQTVAWLAAEGVETLYVQTGRVDSPDAVVDRPTLEALIAAARTHGVSVVGWYLPSLLDLDTDLARMLAALDLDLDGFGVDIEARDVADIDERNTRLIRLSAALRAEAADRTVSAIVLPPVVIEDISQTFWPRFPWAEIAPFYDVWLPMAYWTNRRGAWRSGYEYTAANVDRVRERLGDPEAPVHVIGGISDRVSEADINGFVIAARERSVLGGSMYDVATSHESHWPYLRRLRSDA